MRVGPLREIKAKGQILRPDSLVAPFPHDHSSRDRLRMINIPPVAHIFTVDNRDTYFRRVVILHAILANDNVIIGSSFRNVPIVRSMQDVNGRKTPANLDSRDFQRPLTGYLASQLNQTITDAEFSAPQRLLPLWQASEMVSWHVLKESLVKLVICLGFQIDVQQLALGNVGWAEQPLQPQFQFRATHLGR